MDKVLVKTSPCLKAQQQLYWLACIEQVNFCPDIGTDVRAQYVRMPNTYDSYVLGWNSHFWLKMSCSAQYVRMAMTLKILQVLIILPLKIYKFTKDKSTHGNFVQRQLDPRQFRPRTTRPTAISSKDNSTHGNFVQRQLDKRQFRPRTTRPTAISSIFNRGCLYKD